MQDRAEEQGPILDNLRDYIAALLARPYELIIVS